MTKSIRVKALWIKGRACYVLRWRDAAGKWREETTDIPATPRNRRRANDAARDKTLELLGKRKAPYSWAEFDERYKDEWLSAKRPGTRITWDTATACLHSWRMGVIPSPSEIDSDFLHSWAAWMRRKGYAEATIKSYLGILRAGVNWAAEVGIVATVPRFPRIDAGGKMGGRPITGEEFDRMLAAVKKERPRDYPAWRQFLNGLWLSGLRIGEAAVLSWDYGAGFAVDLDAACFAIRQQKSGKVEYAPMAPDFAEWLHKIPDAKRCGRVFSIGVEPNHASRIISAIGKRAGILTIDGCHATAHDLRRSFGTRWASKVHPAELQKLMRHADITTTMKYYVRLDSAALARKLAMGGKSGEMVAHKPAQARRSKSPEA
jgi:integrase